MHLDSKKYTTIPVQSQSEIEDSEARFELSRRIGDMEGDWKAYIEVAQRFQYKVKNQDGEDIKQAIILELAQAKARDGDKPFPKARMYRIASYVVADYWRTELKNGRTSSLDFAIGDIEGIELIDTLADDKAIDLEAWIDAKTWLSGCPMRLIEIAHKTVKGESLNLADRLYLCKWRKRQQQRLF
jgi:DNA-directed RNA polymerase specialized sigma24 family protein